MQKLVAKPRKPESASTRPTRGARVSSMFKEW
ncbi:MAG: hypothetical protein QOE90_1273 [Thermoplasmata archaeon]|jgi:hypothetical protein|nr:hypothetical protein [Thermoplasmata archaeon]